MSVLPMAPPAKSPLARYRLLSPSASVRVSPLCLGAMNFGNAWKDYMGPCDQKTTEGILDFFYENGGNFIDTANNYQFEESETWIGEWMKKRGNRDEMVIATKYTTNYRAGHGDTQIMANFTGNSTKSMHVSVQASLKKLQTDYIDLLYVHWWDFSTSIPELMQSLNNLVTSGKVLYLGISDTPAWIVSKANQYARDHNLRPFSVYQGRWSAASRDFEREIIPMCRDEGMGIAPWGALGGGSFKTEEQRKAGAGRKNPPSEAQIKTSQALEVIAKRKDTIITSVALAYVMHKAPYVFPIVGGRNTDHLKGNIEALKLRLSEEDIAEIDGAVPFDLGFPHNFMYLGEKPPANPADVWLLGMAGTYDYVPIPKPISSPEAGEESK
ncbi:norsolorinic acid reductase [Bombardia bombarda]|uniref:Norsolorinic acid reductase n=1 Tax=Bombardia bombarda TaxID=252184 RepID=A0AA39XNG5_9PEZI|nr:norsolorinic acid reductase [Bombardia bombarda]